MLFNDQVIADQQIYLDGKSYERCTFRRVEFIYTGFGGVNLNNCDIQECTWTFSGPAEKALVFMSAVYNGFGEGGRLMMDKTMDGIRSGQYLGGDQETKISFKPTIFIGHGRSSDYALLKNFLVEEGYEVETFESKPRAGMSAKDVVESMARRASLAFLVHTAEDEQGGEKVRARENVVHETGLFQGMLGFQRAIVLREEGCEPFSNLDGVQYIPFAPGNIRHTFLEVRETIRREFPTSS